MAGKRRGKCYEGDTYVCSTHGYVMELHNGKWVRQHRLRMEKKLGRKLERWEVVHHRDDNKENNDLDNLRLMNDPDHKSLHSSKRKHKPETKLKMSKAAKEIASDPEERKRRSERAKQQHFECRFGKH
jgi:hypothetical protein